MTAKIPGPWVYEAACAGMDPELFFPERGDSASVRKAREVCDRCPVQLECRRYATRARERWGIWGGTSFNERSGKTGRIAARRKAS